MKGLFVTGTDTGVGKTFVACAILRALRRRGLDVGAMKPAETDVAPGEDPADATALRAASESGDPLELVCPLRYRAPLAPLAAARAEGREVPLAPVREAFEVLSQRHAFLVVEGAGGLLVPLAKDFTYADLAVEMKLPVLVVARRGLGTLNHTALTLEACAARSLAVEGVILNRAPGAAEDVSEETNAAVLHDEFGARVLAELGPLADIEAAAGELENQMPEVRDRWAN